MLDNKINTLESSSGFPYRRMILIVSGLILLLTLALGILNTEPTGEGGTDWSFFLVIGGNTLILGVLLSLFIPNTYHVKLKGNNIEVSSKSKSELIPLTSISSIQPGLNFVNSWLSTHDIFVIDFREKTKFGKSICFKTSGQSLFNSEPNFGDKLKSEWIRKMYANKGYGQSPTSRYKRRRR